MDRDVYQMLREEEEKAHSLGSGRPCSPRLLARHTAEKGIAEGRKHVHWQQHRVCRELQSRHQTVGDFMSREVDKGQ